MGFGGGFNAPVFSDRTNGGRKIDATVTSKSAVSGVIDVKASDITSGVILCNESRAVLVTFVGTASEFISTLGAQPGDVYKLIIANSESGALRLDYQALKGNWIFCGDSQTSGIGLLEMNFVVVSKDTVFATSIAHNQIIIK